MQNLEGIGRRAFLRSTGGSALLALAPRPVLDRALAAAAAPARPGRFLTAHELGVLRAVCARFVPGPPEDPDPGALEAHVPEAIDLLLGTFRTRAEARIHAGGPFSGRHGGRRDDFARFVALDRQAELGWRIRIEGSRGLKSREFAGPVRGWRQIYRDGLHHLDERAGGDFAGASPAAQTAILGDPSDEAVQELVGTALGHTIEFMYGPPEYGGNHGLAGWTPLGWEGDVQPRGFTAAQVTGSGKLLPSLTAGLLARMAPGLGRPVEGP